MYNKSYFSHYEPLSVLKKFNSKMIISCLFIAFKGSAVLIYTLSEIQKILTALELLIQSFVMAACEKKTFNMV